MSVKTDLDESLSKALATFQDKDAAAWRFDPAATAAFCAGFEAAWHYWFPGGNATEGTTPMTTTAIRQIMYPCQRCGNGAARHVKGEGYWSCDDGARWDSQTPYMDSAGRTHTVIAGQCLECDEQHDYPPRAPSE